MCEDIMFTCESSCPPGISLVFNKLNNVFTVGARTLRVWSREGVLSSTGENVDGLEQALFWK